MSPEEILGTTGIDIETTCEENLISYGFFPVVSNVQEGLLDNPEVEVHLEGNIAIKTNATQPLCIDVAKTKLSAHIQKWVNYETERLISNTGFSPEVYLISLSMQELPSSLVSCHRLITNKLKITHEFLRQIQEATNVEQLKRLFNEFEQLTYLHGDS